jgi:hypothetical protein
MITNIKFDYPALYKGAGQLSAESQSYYLNLIRAEYVALLVAAVLSLNLSSNVIYLVSNAFVFLVAIGILLTRSSQRPEQDWYKGRALAESIKTSCWRYCMRAEPFGDVDSVAERKSEFRAYLLKILETNRHIGDRIPPDSAAEHQITPSMEAIRALSLEERKTYYHDNRIKEQRIWYVNKARSNANSSKRWVRFGVAVYALAIIFVLLRIAYPQQTTWPTEPLIVLASAVIGWTQVKKFNELSSSYTLTAHEIGIIQGRVADISEEEDFSDFVNEAEQAFSREHTQWVARQS